MPNFCSAIRATLGQRQFRQSPGLALNADSGNEWGKIPVLTGTIESSLLALYRNPNNLYHSTVRTSWSNCGKIEDMIWSVRTRKNSDLYVSSTGRRLNSP